MKLLRIPDFGGSYCETSLDGKSARQRTNIMLCDGCITVLV